VFHLFDDDDVPGPPCPVGYTLATHTWQLFQGPKEDVSHHGDKGRACIIFLALTDGIQDCSIHLETHEDVFVPPQPLGGTTGHLLGDQRATPFITIFGALPSILAHVGLH